MLLYLAGAGMNTWQVTYNCSAAPDSTVKLSGNVKDTSTSCTASDEDTAILDGTPDPYLLIVAGDVEPYCKGATSAIVNFNITSSLPPANWTYNLNSTTGTTCMQLGLVELVDLGNGNSECLHGQPSAISHPLCCASLIASVMVSSMCL
jgi:hypothetical protein